MTTLENRPNTALLVIDVQNGVVEGAHERDAVVANVGSLGEKGRRGGGPGGGGAAWGRAVRVRRGCAAGVERCAWAGGWRPRAPAAAPPRRAGSRWSRSTMTTP